MQRKRGARDAMTPSAELVKQVGAAVRRMGAQNVITSQVVAGRFGMNTTDLECLDLINLGGKASAGELAKATGLTSGAMTALIDRLEKAGYVVREGDPADRRKRYVRLCPEAIEPIKAVYEPMQAEMFKLWSSFRPRELRVIADFLSRSTALAVECVERIRSAAMPATAEQKPARKKSKKKLSA